MTDQPGYEMELERTFDAPREDVFDCFTNAGAMKAWWGPRDFTNPVCEIDARMGGHLLIHMQGPEPFGVSPMEGDFSDAVRPALAGMREGWCQSFDKLDRLLARPPG